MRKIEQNVDKLRTAGAAFIEREMKAFMDDVINDTFVPDLVTDTEPRLCARYSRMPEKFKRLHIDTWSGPRGQEIIDASPTLTYQWNFRSGWCVSEHPLIAILFVWYDGKSHVVGLDGPSKLAVLSFAEAQNRLYHSQTLYTQSEIEAFKQQTAENLIYLQNFVHP